MIRKFIGLTLICAVIYVAFFLLENCHSEGGGKQPLASSYPISEMRLTAQ